MTAATGFPRRRCLAIGVLATTMTLLVPESSGFVPGPIVRSGQATVPPPFLSASTKDEIERDSTTSTTTTTTTTTTNNTVDQKVFPESLFAAAELASIPKSAETETGAHDAFRFEWGRWVDDDALAALMEQVNEIVVPRAGSVYDRLLEMEMEMEMELPPTDSFLETNDPEEDETNDDKTENDNETENNGGGETNTVETQQQQKQEQKQNKRRRYRIAGGDNWDCILHVLPKDAEWKGRWPTGSWAIVRALSGMAETNLMRGPDRNGFYKKATTTKLRGGGDGTLGSGGGRGEDCVKYVGGALRSYSGVGGKTMVLEVAIRPPMGRAGVDGDGNLSSSIEVFPAEDPVVAELLRFVEEKDDDEEEEEEDDNNDDNINDKEDTEEEDGKDEETEGAKTSLGAQMGLAFEKVGGLDDQLNDIVRRVLASRANPEVARKLGVNHVRGILLSGPPGCGKTLLARELSAMLGAREPQIVNGPEILDKFIGEAEKNVRALFRPAEIEYDQVGDASALHVIVLDELDAIARKRGSVSGDSTGVRDSVVNQLLSKMDGVKEANNVLVIGLTNRPELLDPALTRPGRLEVQLRVELPDIKGRRDILRIHTRHMKKEGGLDRTARAALEDIDTEDGIPAKTEYFTGAELAGLVRSAASFAIARVVDESYGGGDTMVGVDDFRQALNEVRPALGKQDEILESRFPYGISPFSDSMQRLMRDLGRFTSTPSHLAEQGLTAAFGLDKAVSQKPPSTLHSLLLVGDGHKGGTGATALACWAASQASTNGEADYVRLVTSLDLLVSAADSGDESARATAMVERFIEAASMSRSLLVFDDIDQICAGQGPGGYSTLMLSTLRALLRSPAARSTKIASDSMDLNNSDIVESNSNAKAKSLSIIACTSRTDAVCSVLRDLFDETLVVPELSDFASIQKLFSDGVQKMGAASTCIDNEVIDDMAKLAASRLDTVGCKTALRMLERTVSMSYRAMRDAGEEDPNKYLLGSLTDILDDYLRDREAAEQIVCNIY